MPSQYTIVLGEDVHEQAVCKNPAPWHPTSLELKNPARQDSMSHDAVSLQSNQNAPPQAGNTRWAWSRGCGTIGQPGWKTSMDRLLDHEGCFHTASQSPMDPFALRVWWVTCCFFTPCSVHVPAISTAQFQIPEWCKKCPTFRNRSGLWVSGSTAGSGRLGSGENDALVPAVVQNLSRLPHSAVAPVCGGDQAVGRFSDRNGDAV